MIKCYNPIVLSLDEKQMKTSS